MLKTLLYVFIKTVLICRLLRCYYIKKCLLVHSHIRFHDANKYRTNAPFTELGALWKRNWQQLRSIFVEACNVHIYLPIRVEGVAKRIWLLRLRQQKNWIGFCDKTFVALANGLVCRVLYRELSSKIDNSAFLSAFTWTKSNRVIPLLNDTWWLCFMRCSNVILRTKYKDRKQPKHPILRR